MSRALGLGFLFAIVVSAGAVILDPLAHAPIRVYRPNDPALVLMPTAGLTSSGDDYTVYTLPPLPDLKPYGFTAGDANCDGVVNTRDIDAVANVLACQAQGQAPWWSCWGLADVNQDGEITCSDLEVLAVYLSAGSR